MSLAISSYNNLNTLTDSPRFLNLGWTLDERQFLSVDLKSIISLEMETEIKNDLQYINSYFVKDPYGEEIMGTSVANFFSKTSWSYCITCGAGVISLLYSLAKLSNGKPVSIIGDTYPDFPYWVEQFKGKCLSPKSNQSLEYIVSDIRAADSSLIFLERPSLIGDRFSDLSGIEALCRGGETCNAIVIVDESNANYYSPAFSAVNLVDEINNLIVLRGFSKAYGLGGLRLAYCISSTALKERIRKVIPPLLASSLSLGIGKKILELGDITLPLRQRIRKKKEKMKIIFELAQINEVQLSSENLPYILLQNSPEYIDLHLESNGILGKFHPIRSEVTGMTTYLYRLSVPLNAKRMNLLKEKIQAVR